jgi:hypothetical protein
MREIPMTEEGKYAVLPCPEETKGGKTRWLRSFERACQRQANPRSG